MKPGTVAERLHALSLRTDGGYTSAEIHAVLRDWARQNPPRCFTLYQVIEDEAGFDGDGLSDDQGLANNLPGTR